MAKVISSTYDPVSGLYNIDYDDGSSDTSENDVAVGTSDGQATGSDAPSSTSQTTATTPTKNSYDVSGYTYTKNPDGTYVKIDESGVSHASNATEFNAAASGKDPATLSPTLDPSQVSTTPTTSRTTSTVTGTGDPTTLSGLISRAATGTLSAKDIASFAAANAGNIAAMTGLAALTGGNTPTTGAYTGKIPTLQAIRNQVNAAVSPGQSQQYFTDTRYVNPADAAAVAAAKEASASQTQAIIDAAQKQAASRIAAQPAVPGFAMPWVNQTAVGNTPVTAGNNFGLPAVIDRSSPGYNNTPQTGIGTIATPTITPVVNPVTPAVVQPTTLNPNTTTNPKTNTPTLTPEQIAAQNYLASIQAPTASQVASFQGTNPTDMSSLITKAVNNAMLVNPATANKTIANLMDAYKVTPAEMAAATGFTAGEITNLYNQAKGNTTAPVATTDAATIMQQLQNTVAGATPSNTASMVAGLNNIIAANPGITTAQIQAMFPTTDLTPYFKQGVVAPGSSTYKAPTAATIAAAPVNALRNDVIATGGAGIAALNSATPVAGGSNLDLTAVPQLIKAMQERGISNTDIANTFKSQGVNAGQIASVMPAGDAAAIYQAFGQNVPAGTAGIAAIPTPTSTLTPAAVNTPTYTPYSQQQMSDYVTANNINVADPAALAQAVAATNADPGAVASWIASSAGDGSGQGAKTGGLMGYAHGGISNIPRYLRGDTDGMADDVPSSIDGVQPAKLSHGEFVIPADVVSHLGNGNSDAGAKKLYQMMDRVRLARTGTKKQGKEINPDKFMVGGHAYAKGGEIAFATGATVPTGTSSGVSVPSLGYSTVNALSPWAGDYVTNMLGSAQALAQGPMPVYQGELTAGPSALQQQQFAGLSALAQTGAPPVQFQTGTWSNQGAPAMPDVTRPSDTSLVSQAANQGTAGYGQPLQLNTANTGIAGQYMNPYLQQSLQPQLDLLARQSQISTLGDLGKMTQQGAFGGSRQAVLQGINEGNLLGQQANLIGQGYNTAYQNAMNQFNQEQQNALTAQNYQQQANQASANFGLQSLNALGTAGATQQGLTQAADTAAQNQFNQQALYPYQQLQFEQSMLSNLPISTQAVIPNTSPIGNAAGALNTSISLTDALKQLGQATTTP